MGEWSSRPILISTKQYMNNKKEMVLSLDSSPVYRLVESVAKNSWHIPVTHSIAQICHDKDANHFHIVSKQGVKNALN